jgi:hypothetical protein
LECYARAPLDEKEPATVADIRSIWMMRKFFSLALVAFCVPMLATADVYRWVGPDGVVNYTQMKPQGVQAERVRTQGGRPSAAAAAPSAAAEQPASRNADASQLSPKQKEMLDDLQSAEAARKQEVARIREANCERSRKVLDRLSANARIRVRDDSGEERVMGEDERQDRITEAQQGVAENCVS